MMTDQVTECEDPAFSVIIPAHNEAVVIARCLEAIFADAPANHNMQVIIAANGCTDQTAEIAKAAAPDALVLNIAQGSKTRAMNAANSESQHFPRIYLDADVQCSYSSLAALATVLEQPGVMTAAPEIRLDTSRLTWATRAYYRAWLRQPYATAGKGGAGCYGLSREGFATIGPFPPIIADDFWIHTRFSDAQKRYVTQDESGTPVFSIVHPPRTAMEQIRVEARRRIGNMEVHKSYPGPYLDEPGSQGGLRAAFSSGASLFDLTVFFTLKACAALLARWRLKRGQGAVWSRDLTSRGA
jgi:glycosyltransferase involved in cell wall biosynthesis